MAEPNSKMVRRALGLLGYAVLGLVVGWAIFARFSNPTLTETQLLLLLWPIAILALVGIALIAYGERGSN